LNVKGRYKHGASVIARLFRRGKRWTWLRARVDFVRSQVPQMKVSEIIKHLLNPQGAPRDGVTILGGEPFLQPNGLLALMQSLKRRDQHIMLYTGYTLEDLLSRDDRSIKRILGAKIKFEMSCQTLFGLMSYRYWRHC
jgi:organic radical activating enzyme